MLWSRLPLALYFTHGSGYVSILISQSVPSSPSLWVVGVVACDRLFRFRLFIFVLIYIDRLILFILAFFQSAVTCLQWPAEYIIVFGLAEGKVKEGSETQERLWMGIMVLERGI